MTNIKDKIHAPIVIDECSCMTHFEKNKLVKSCTISGIPVIEITPINTDTRESQ